MDSKIIPLKFDNLIYILLSFIACALLNAALPQNPWLQVLVFFGVLHLGYFIGRAQRKFEEALEEKSDIIEQAIGIVVHMPHTDDSALVLSLINEAGLEKVIKDKNVLRDDGSTVILGENFIKTHDALSYGDEVLISIKKFT